MGAVRYLNSISQMMITVYLLTMVVSLFALFFLVMRIKPSPFRTSFAAAQVMTILWLYFAMFERVSLGFYKYAILTITEPVIPFLEIRGSLVCISFIAPIWLITILFYTERLPRKRYWLIPVILATSAAPVVSLLAPVSSPLFRLYIEGIYIDEEIRALCEDWGSMEKAAGIVALACTVLMFYLLFSWFRKNSTMGIIEKTAMLLVLCLPIVLHYYDQYNDYTFDATPLAFTLLGVVTIYLASQRQFFNAMPGLVWNIFNVTKDSMAVIGASGPVAVNEAFRTAFGDREGDFFAFADELSCGLGNNIRKQREFYGIEVEKDGIHYEVSVKAVTDRKGKIRDQLVTIRDVSAAKKLAMENERARIASAMHDNLGNRIVATLNNLDLATIKPTNEEAAPYLDKAKTQATASLMVLRRIVEGLSPVDFGKAKLAPMLNSVINRITATGMDVELEIFDDLEAMPIPVKEYIYNSCQEALTNSYVHGRAKLVVIGIECEDGILRMRIADNGRGCKEINKNNGLTTMEDRAAALGGEIAFGTPLTGGFGISVEIPY